MPDSCLIFPIVIVFAGALSAVFFGCLPSSRRPSAPATALFLSIAPLTAFLSLAYRIPWLEANLVVTWQLEWLPALGLRAGLYFDSLSALFALLITFIGTLVVIYAGYYFKGDEGVWRFFAYILLFMGCMLGLVMAGDVLTLFIFWEGTSVVSFLLVAYKFEDESARQGAFKALLITGGGGIALLLGLLLVVSITGDSRFATILSSGEALRGHRLYPLMLGLIALGAFTKSAQFPFHIWLPVAMSAPTPASAYLHSATMVKAGIYLMARLNPVLGQTESWFWLLTVAGMITMMTGAVLGLKKNDLKAMLAYSTVCQLGILMMMIGQDVEISFKALIIGILAHALYKSALFLVAGIVDHEAGTRDLRRLGGLRRAMPLTFAIGLLAALSMAGLPPLFGFLAKETLLATAVHPSLPAGIAWIFVLSSVSAGALMLAISGRLIADTFLGRPRDPGVRAHEAPFLMLLAPGIPAILSLLLGQLPGPKTEAALLANAAAAAHGATVKVSLKLWTGLNIPLLLSIAAISAGTIIFVFRRRLIDRVLHLRNPVNVDRLFEFMLRGTDAAANTVLRLQHGKLRFYLAIMLTATVALLIGFGGFPPPLNLTGITAPTFSFAGELALLRIVALFVIAGTSLACVVLTNDFFAILAFGASGLGVAVLMALEPAPDVALVQIVVDILLVVILVLALARLPARKLQDIQELAFRQNRGSLLRDGLISGIFGILVMLMSLSAILSRPRISALTAYFEANAKKAAGARSIVGAILTDFRGLDTLVEIAVFSLAGIGIYTLIRFAARKFDYGCPTDDECGWLPGADFSTLGIGGLKTSPLLRVLARIILPLSMVIGICDLLYGHDKPGDGFTAGVIVSIGIGFWYVVFGYHETRQRLGWLKPSRLIGWGILLAILSGASAVFVRSAFFANVDFGAMLGLPLPKGVHLSTSMLFELAIFLSVLGSAVHMLNTLGHPEESEV